MEFLLLEFMWLAVSILLNFWYLWETGSREFERLEIHKIILEQMFIFTLVWSTTTPVLMGQDVAHLQIHNSNTQHSNATKYLGQIQKVPDCLCRYWRFKDHLRLVECISLICGEFTDISWDKIAAVIAYLYCSKNRNIYPRFKSFDMTSSSTFPDISMVFFLQQLR